MTQHGLKLRLLVVVVLATLFHGPTHAEPLEAAKILGPYTCGTHMKDYAVEETARGFRLTTVPLGCGSLQVAETIERLAKHAPPDISWTLEAIYGSYGSELEVHWLKDSFWELFQNKTARQVASCLRHIRSRSIDIGELMTAEDVDRLKLSHAEHIEFEAGCVRRGIAYMKDVLADIDQTA